MSLRRGIDRRGIWSKASLLARRRDDTEYAADLKVGFEKSPEDLAMFAVVELPGEADDPER
jgi:hypothetical protein